MTPDKDTPSPDKAPGDNALVDNGNAADVATLQARFNAEREARLKAEKAYAERRALFDRQTQELGELRRRTAARQEPDRFEANDPGYEPEPEVPRRSDGRFKKQRDEGEAFASACDGFQLDLMRSKLPQWEGYYDKAIEFIKDPINAEAVAAFNADGLVDYRKTLRNALREIRLRDYETATQKSQSKRTELEVQLDAQKDRAVVSGGGATETEETIDLRNMSAEEMVKRGLIPIDKSDPPSFARNSMSALK